jgi:hypothetical protein
MPEYMRKEQDVHSIKSRIANKRGLEQERNKPLKSLDTLSKQYNDKHKKYHGSGIFSSLLGAFM